MSFCLEHLLIQQTFRHQHSVSHTHRKRNIVHSQTYTPVLWANHSCESAIGNVATKASTWYAGICFVAYLHCSTVQSNCCLAGPAKSFLFSFPLLPLIIFSLPSFSVWSSLVCFIYMWLNRAHHWHAGQWKVQAELGDHAGVFTGLSDKQVSQRPNCPVNISQILLFQDKQGLRNQIVRANTCTRNCVMSTSHTEIEIILYLIIIIISNVVGH